MAKISNDHPGCLGLNAMAAIATIAATVLAFWMFMRPSTSEPVIDPGATASAVFDTGPATPVEPSSDAAPDLANVALEPDNFQLASPSPSGNVIVDPKPLAAAAPPTVHEDNEKRVELQDCQASQGGTTCTLWVTTSKRVNWWFSPFDALVNKDGRAIPADQMCIAGICQTLADLHIIGRGQYIEPGDRTKITLNFAPSIIPGEIQSLKITKGWKGPMLNFSPISWAK